MLKLSIKRVRLIDIKEWGWAVLLSCPYSYHSRPSEAAFRYAKVSIKNDIHLYLLDSIDYLEKFWEISRNPWDTKPSTMSVRLGRRPCWSLLKTTTSFTDISKAPVDSCDEPILFIMKRTAKDATWFSFIILYNFGSSICNALKR